MARPKAEIDWDTVEKLCAIHCTGEEIASIVEVHYDTLANRIKDEFELSFSEYYKKHSARGKMSLRRKQHEVALSGNTTMLIWLGKQYLEQSDKQEVESTHGVNSQPITVNVGVTDARKPNTE